MKRAAQTSMFITYSSLHMSMMHMSNQAKLPARSALDKQFLMPVLQMFCQCQAH